MLLRYRCITRRVPFEELAWASSPPPCQRCRRPGNLSVQIVVVGILRGAAEQVMGAERPAWRFSLSASSRSPAASGAASGVPARRPMCSPREAAGRYGPPSTSESPAHHLRPTGAGGSSAGWGFPSHIPERRQPIPSSLFDKAWNPVLPIS